MSFVIDIQDVPRRKVKILTQPNISAFVKMNTLWSSHFKFMIYIIQTILSFFVSFAWIFKEVYVYVWNIFVLNTDRGIMLILSTVYFKLYASPGFAKLSTFWQVSQNIMTKQNQISKNYNKINQKHRTALGKVWQPYIEKCKSILWQWKWMGYPTIKSKIFLLKQ